MKMQNGRAAVSITSNIAEGFSRDTLKDKGHFYTIAKGSLTEVENQLIISRDVGYLSLHMILRLLKGKFVKQVDF